jgi:hypothetical protein
LIELDLAGNIREVEDAKSILNSILMLKEFEEEVE